MSANYKTATVTSCSSSPRYKKTTKTCSPTYLKEGWMCTKGTGATEWIAMHTSGSSCSTNGSSKPGKACTTSNLGEEYITGCSIDHWSLSTSTSTVTSCSTTSSFTCSGSTGRSGSYVSSCTSTTPSYSTSTSTQDIYPASSCSATSKTCDSSTAGTSWVSSCSSKKTGYLPETSKCERTYTVSSSTCGITGYEWGDHTVLNDRTYDATYNANATCDANMNPGAYKYVCTDNSTYSLTTKYCSADYGWTSTSVDYVGSCSQSTWTYCDSGHSGQYHYDCEY